MSASGFDYVPFDPNNDHPQRVRSFRAEVVAGTGDLEFGLDGYGITTAALAASPFTFDDPNRAIINALSEEDRTAYAFSFDKCNREAWEDLGIDLEMAAETTQAFWDAVARLDQAILLDLRVTEATPAWSKCMKNLGYSYASIEEPAGDVRQEIQNVLDRFNLLTVDEDDLAELAQATDETLEYERDIATDDVACREESGLSDVLADVRIDHEATFLRSEKATVDAYWDTWSR